MSNNGWSSLSTYEEACVLQAARIYGKLLCDPEHAYSDELEAEENLMQAIAKLVENEEQ